MTELWAWRCECGETDETQRPVRLNYYVDDCQRKFAGPAPLPDGWTTDGVATLCVGCSTSSGDQLQLQLGSTD